MSRPSTALTLRILTHVGALLPLAWVVADLLYNVNPIQAATLRTGRYALILLLLSLACTPLNALFGWRAVMPLRRTLGLYAFFYAALHFLIFIGLDYGFKPALILSAIFEKRYALAGLAAFLVLLALAATSSRGWMNRLGPNWKRLHRLVYVAGLLAIIHFLWLVKADYRRPLMYGAVLAVLLALRHPVVKQWLIRAVIEPAKKRLPGRGR